MQSRRILLMACFILLPFLLGNCGFLSSDLDAEGEDSAAVETTQQVKGEKNEGLTEAEEAAIEDSVLGSQSKLQVGEMPMDELNLEVRKLKLN